MAHERKTGAREPSGLDGAVEQPVRSAKRPSRGIGAPAAGTEKPATGSQVRPGGGHKAPRPAGCRHFARARMAEAMPQLVETLVERSSEGSLGHMRLLVQLSGLDETPPPSKRRRGKSIAATLAEEWRLRTAATHADGVDESSGDRAAQDGSNTAHE